MFTLFHLNCLALLLFRSNDIGQIMGFLAQIGTSLEVGASGAWLIPMLALVGPLVLMESWQAVARDHEVVLRSPWWVRGGVYAVLILSIVLLGEDREVAYVYFQF